mmetsp:Transcript_38237/g.34121  ORF Transcript_38237/g.34121 Transcript_38237/m.34121 type:complete len:95 (-) Transcript_38237:36-320(-)
MMPDLAVENFEKSLKYKKSLYGETDSRTVLAYFNLAEAELNTDPDKAAETCKAGVKQLLNLMESDLVTALESEAFIKIAILAHVDPNAEDSIEE